VTDITKLHLKPVYISITGEPLKRSTDLTFIGSNCRLKEVCMNIKRAAIFILCLIISTLAASADPKGKGNDKEKDHPGGDYASGISTQVSVDIFVGNDHDTIRNHFLDNQGNLPPGLAKRGGDLPPGLAKQLRRNGHLPPGLAKRFHPFPVELERKLPPLREGLVRGMIGFSAIIMNEKTSLILDVVKVF
jgi:hypothetical protein